MGWDGYGGGPGTDLEGLGGMKGMGRGMEGLGCVRRAWDSGREPREEVKGKEMCGGQGGVWRA